MIIKTVQFVRVLFLRRNIGSTLEHIQVMKMIANPRQKNVRMRIEETQTIPVIQVMVVIDGTNQELFFLC